MKLLKPLVVCSVTLPLLILLMISPNKLEVIRVWEAVGVPADFTPQDRLQGGLIAAGFDEQSCLSRYQSSFYRKTSPHHPSPYLLSRLRSYEELHKQCGPNSQSYKEALNLLSTDKNHQKQNSTSSSACNYLIFMNRDGVGNRMLGIASAFLYALLTNRVLLVDNGNDLSDLFCEPFPETSWYLPKDSPIKAQFRFHRRTTLGSIVRNNNNTRPSTESLPPHLYLYLAYDAWDHDLLFYCDEYQDLLKNVPWLIMETNNYIVPGLFLIPSLEKELIRLFPKKDTVFHHLGRYIFHPTNAVWGLITRSYNAYLAHADERIGIQIRNFFWEKLKFEDQRDQILNCTEKENLLPGVDLSESLYKAPSRRRKGKAVLVTSMNSSFAEAAKSLYWEHPSADGEVVGIFQASHEHAQRTGNKIHNRKALAEIYLLSLCDKLVTSAWSTFGYVAHGLAGVEPWILYKPESGAGKGLNKFRRFGRENMTAHSEPCGRGLSLEPCFHTPPFCNDHRVCMCNELRKIYEGNVGPYVRPCEDVSWGFKVFDA